MEIYLFSRPQVEQPAGELKRLIGRLEDILPGYRVNREFAAKLAAETGIAIPVDKQYDAMPHDGRKAVAVSYGGDGTFLDCARMVGDARIPILGVNSGRLGFLANVPLEGMEEAFREIAAGNYTVEERPLIEVEGDFAQQPPYPFAFNEFSLQRGGAGMIAVETYVDSEMIATYWGDGALLSTPAGSTAYSLSAGGPVLVPGCECFVISPIAPHNLTMRPVVIPNGCEVVMRVRTRHENPYVTLDNLTFPVRDGAQFRLLKAKKFTYLVKLQNISFYDTLRNKMMWGVDRRTEGK